MIASEPVTKIFALAAKVYYANLADVVICSQIPRNAGNSVAERVASSSTTLTISGALAPVTYVSERGADVVRVKLEGDSGLLFLKALREVADEAIAQMERGGI